MNSRLRLKLEFDGRGFCGWQMQAEDREAADAPSIQATLEKACAVILRAPGRVVVQGCGRTDAGVHAETFHCHFDLPGGATLTEAELEKFRHGLNAILPEGVAVIEAAPAAADFHALENVVRKTYEYRLLLRRAKPVLERGRVHWLPTPPHAFDLKLFSAAVEAFRGPHDFVAFASVHGTAKTTRRTIARAEVEAVWSADRTACRLYVRFEGDGFLKQQVRTMVGTALEVAEGKRTLASVAELLARPGTRPEAGFCVPADGLFLKNVVYDG